jgi:hypothetical protein
MNTFTPIWETVPKTNLQSSASGNFLLNGDALWEWNGTQYNNVATMVRGATSAIFKGDDKMFLFYQDNAQPAFSVIDLQTLTLERSVPIEIRYPRYDVKSNLIGGFTNASMFTLYSPLQNTAVATFRVSYAAPDMGIYLILVNNNIISSTGFIQPLSFFYP